MLIIRNLESTEKCIRKIKLPQNNKHFGAFLHFVCSVCHYVCIFIVFLLLAFSCVIINFPFSWFHYALCKSHLVRLSREKLVAGI